MSLRSLASKLSFVSQAVLGGCTFSRRIFDACTSHGHKCPLSRATHAFPRAWVHAWSEKQVWHVNIKELWAVSCSLELWAPWWGNHNVAVASDNVVVVSWNNSGPAWSSEAMAILRKIFWAVASHHLQLKAVWIPSTAYIATNVGSRFQFDCRHCPPSFRHPRFEPSSPVFPLHPLPYLLPLLGSPHLDIAEAQDELGLVAALCIQSALADFTFATYRSTWHAFFRFLLAYEWVAILARQEFFVW
jgi:hypothetical protein